jgi:hypothetical protein
MYLLAGKQPRCTSSGTTSQAADCLLVVCDTLSEHLSIVAWLPDCLIRARSAATAKQHESPWQTGPFEWWIARNIMAHSKAGTALNLLNTCRNWIPASLPLN